MGVAGRVGTAHVSMWGTAYKYGLKVAAIDLDKDEIIRRFDSGFCTGNHKFYVLERVACFLIVLKTRLLYL